ncbi:MAG: ABC transporter permease subunit [Armatimonadetes bacterium]|nr:ABC transporter permease subunit [Armatimonadota bacterium]
MLAYLYGSTLKDFLRPARVITWVLMAVVIGVLANLLTRIMQERQAIYQFGQISGLMVYRIVALAATMFATAVVNQEVEQKTITYLLTRPIPRWQILICRYLAAVTATFVVTLFSLIAVSIGVPDIGPLHQLVLRDIVTLLLGSFAYSALFVMVSLLIHRPMIWCLLFAFGWEVAVPNMPGSTFYLSINSYLNSFAHHPESESRRSFMQFLSQQIGSQSVPVITAVSVLVLLSVALVAAASYWFSFFEYVPREETE